MSRHAVSPERPTSTIGSRPTKRPLEPIQHVLSWDDIPTWMQIDPYIRRGYRRQLDTLSACFWSLFYPHNELVNTWSHLLPALFYLSGLVGVEWGLLFRIKAEKASKQEDNAMIQLYAVGTVICLLASVCRYLFLFSPTLSSLIESSLSVTSRLTIQVLGHLPWNLRTF